MARRVIPGDDRARFALAVVVATAVFAVWNAVAWVSAATDDTLDTAAVRDEALAAGRDHVVALTTMDHNDVETGLRRWLEVTTGTLRDELAATEPDTLAAVERARTVATAEVRGAALAELDAERGRATMLASVTITTTREGGEEVAARTRYRLELRDTGDGWKVAELDTVGGAA
ncbi:hypothetical protein [Saccharomonospora piscinae]|uniref:hypothetical protein n=1 Tax=Saccharomonospora piscinae TaxID=687388 RepID=UPI001FC94DF2|nr:hypothetical protein [Saccharomonospora piscinae]